MKKEKKRWFSKKKLWAAGNRLIVALVAVGIAAVLILWDTGVIDLPGLVRHERRTETATEEKSSSTTTRAMATSLHLEPMVLDSRFTS